MSTGKGDYDELNQYEYSDGDFLEKVVNKYSLLVGLFLINFSKLENELNRAIAEIIENDSHEIGFVIIEKITMSNKIDLFYKLYLRLTTFKPKGYKNDLIRAKKELESLNSFRNAVVHANWESLTKEGLVRTKIVVDDEEGYVKFRKVEMLPKTIHQKTEEAAKLTDRVSDFVEAAFQDIK